jgi:hypothetical protein
MKRTSEVDLCGTRVVPLASACLNFPATLACSKLSFHQMWRKYAETTVRSNYIIFSGFPLFYFKLFYFKGPLECDTIQYSLSTSSSTFPSQGYFTRLINNSVIQKQYNYNTSAITLESVRANVLGVSIYYSSLSYTKISEDAKMEPSDLVGAIGGTLGWIEF